MNAPSAQQWIEFSGIVSLELLILFAAGKLVSLRLGAPQHRRCLWHGIILSTLVVVAGEFAGVRELVRSPVAAAPSDDAVPPTRTVVVTIQDPDFPQGPALFAPSEPADVPVASFESPSRWKEPTVWPAWLWLSGTALLLVRIVAGQLISAGFRRWKCRPAEIELQSRAARLAGLLRIRRRVTLLATTKTCVPFTLGTIRPAIVVPAAFADTFTPEQQDAALAHELAHVAGFDSAWRVLDSISCALLWWSPFTWLAARELRHASELAADESSLLLHDGPERLAECLVACARQMQRVAATEWLGIDGGGFRSSLGTRVARLLQLNPGSNVTARVPWFIRVAVPTASALVLWTAAHALTTGDVDQHALGAQRTSLMASALAALVEPKANLSPGSSRSLEARPPATPEEQELKAAGRGATDTAREQVRDTLKRIRILTFGPYANASLMDVIHDLQQTAKASDPEGTGIEFLVSPDSRPAGVTRLDPAGLPVEDSFDPQKVRIRLNTAIKEITLEQALNILVTIADQKIEYSIEGYGVVVSPRAKESAPVLHTRFFRINPYALSRGLSNLNNDDGNPLTNLLSQLAILERTAGINLTAPGKAVFYNDRLGMLMVRATLPDLEYVEKVVKAWDFSAAQLEIRVKAMEVPVDKAAGALAAMGLTNNPRTAAVFYPRTAAVFSDSARMSLANDGQTFADRLTKLPAPTLTAVLTDGQFRSLISDLESSGSSDLMSAPTLTVGSGRQAQIKVVDMRYIVTGLNTNAGPSLPHQDSTGANTPGKDPSVGSAITNKNRITTEDGRYLAELFEIGPIVDLVPYVQDDGYTIQMTVLPSLREFLGYDDRMTLWATGGPFATPDPPQPSTPFPRFRLRQVASTARVCDGQTLVLGAGRARAMETKHEADGSTRTNYVDKELFFFVTPRLIDPAGNALHQDDELEELAKRKGALPQNLQTPDNR
jgi:hypothetical protein